MQNHRGQTTVNKDTEIAQAVASSQNDTIEGNNDSCSSIGSALLRDYQMNLDPLNAIDRAHRNRQDNSEPLNTTSTIPSDVTDSPVDIARSMSTSYPHPLQSSRTFFTQRPGAVPIRATSSHMLKALASRSSQDSFAHEQSGPKAVSTTAPDTGSSSRAFPSTHLTHSPCYFHKRFDDAINIERVLEEMSAEDDGMSHTRLLQTATSVREISKQLQRRSIKRAVRSIMIVTKARDNQLVYLTRELAEYLLKTPRYNADLGVNVYVDAKLRTSKRFDAEGLLALDPRYEQMLHYWTPDLCWNNPEKFDLVLTLGGDGTVLFTSWLFQRVVPPILSFSLGSLGFLTNFPFEGYKPTLDRIMEGSGMRVNMRMRFTCTVYRASNQHLTLPRKDGVPASKSSSPTLTEEAQFEVLNELVIDRGPSPYVSNLELYGDTSLLTIIQADGCIISTPTGSTAYSLSAGGPLTHPSIPGILLTPICPHTLSFRPMVLSDTLCLRICVPKHSRSTAYASFDGKGRVELRRGDEVRVEAGRYPFPTVVGEGGTGGEWFESVRRALRWNTRGAVQKGFQGQQSTMDVSRRAGGRVAADDDIVEESDDVDGNRDSEEEIEEWDIDADPIDSLDGRSVDARDSGIGASEDGSISSSPLRGSVSQALD